MNLSEVLNSPKLNQNLTLNDSFSYYLDRTFDILSDFDIYGKNSNLILSSAGNISNFFIIDNGIHISLTNLNFFFDSPEKNQINSIFLVQNASEIVFLVKIYNNVNVLHLLLNRTAIFKLPFSNNILCIFRFA